MTNQRGSWFTTRGSWHVAVLEGLDDLYSIIAVALARTELKASPLLSPQLKYGLTVVIPIKSDCIPPLKLPIVVIDARKIDDPWSTFTLSRGEECKHRRDHKERNGSAKRSRRDAQR